MNIMTLQTVIDNYVSTIDKDKALRQCFVDKKRQLDNRRSYLYSQLRPGQGSTKVVIDQQYNHSLKQFAADNNVIENLFPLIDMSFLTEPTGSFPRWAIYDANNVEPFRIRYSTLIEFRRFGHWINHKDDIYERDYVDECVKISTSASAFVQPTQYADLFCKSSSPSYDDGLYVTLDKHVFEEVLKLHFTPEMRVSDLSHGWKYTVPAGTELYGQLQDRLLRDGRRELLLVFSATFDHFVPESVNKTIDDFGLLFDQLLFIAEVPDWQPSEITIIPASDPLLIGRRGKEYRLLDAFDVTDAEEYIKENFCL